MRWLWLPLLLTLTAPLLAQPRGAVDLRPRFTPGEVTHSRLIIDTQTETKGLEGSADGSQRQYLEATFRVKTEAADPEAGATLSLTILTLHAERTTAQGGHEIADARTPDANAASKRLASLIERSITVEYAPDGSVSRLEGAEALAEALTAQQSDHPLAAGLVRALTADALKQGLGAGLRVLPEEPVRRGARWETRFTQPIPIVGEARSLWKHRLARIDRSTATIESDISIDLAGAGELMPGITVTLDKAGGEATTVFDTDLHRPVRAESDITMPLRLELPGLDGNPTRIEQTVRTRTVQEEIPQREAEKPRSSPDKRRAE